MDFMNIGYEPATSGFAKLVEPGRFGAHFGRPLVAQ
jgi:hypothetical protein